MIGQKQADLLACLHDNLGRVVSYSTLHAIIGCDPSGRQGSQHLLRQYIWWVKHTLAKQQAPYVVAVTHGRGYALCEVADKEERLKGVV